VEAISSHPN
jgi:serine/threonine protein kinase